MGSRELREKYGGNAAQAVNRAIRAEAPGGEELFSALRAATENRPAREIVAAILAAKRAMGDFIAAKYSLSDGGGNPE